MSVNSIYNCIVIKNITFFNSKGNTLFVMTEITKNKQRRAAFLIPSNLGE